ncbi:MAG TPA: amino acid ABC transporter permease [Roseiflexaceae bacterium]|nr:amino acid ABC transporter permease [Roseiflexaceae bacterium]
MAVTADSAAPPHERRDALGWLRKNLFNTWYNALLTVLLLVLLAALLRPLLGWALAQADWGVVAVNLRLFMVGTFPASELWRAWLCALLAAALLGLSWGIWPRVARDVAVAYGGGLLLLALLPFGLTSRLLLALCSALVFAGMPAGRRAAARGPAAGRWVAGAWVLLLPLVALLLRGVGPGLPVVSTNQWGGLLLTLVLAIVGIVFSFPLGVLLAIGRRSRLPAISLLCTLYIEIIRGVPLITVLFMSQIMLPLFVPGGERIDNVVRAMVGFTLFTAAYVAENVRGGLQAIPRGQEEAARALGLNPLLTLGMIILPQALRIVIPANVGQFISLFKDTSLVAVAGLLDLLGIARSVLAQSEFLGRQAEVLLFVAAVYWVFAYSLTYVSRRLEEVLDSG